MLSLGNYPSSIAPQVYNNKMIQTNNAYLFLFGQFPRRVVWLFARLLKNYQSDFHQIVCRVEAAPKKEPNKLLVDLDQRADPGFISPSCNVARCGVSLGGGIRSDFPSSLFSLILISFCGVSLPAVLSRMFFHFLQHYFFISRSGFVVFSFKQPRLMWNLLLLKTVGLHSFDFCFSFLFRAT